MYELIQVGEQSYYLQSPAKIGIYLKNDKDAYLIDSGNDKDAGRKVRKILEQQGWDLKAILNTHSNADHIGGNSYLQQQYGCKIFSRGIEAAFTQYPLLEPSFLYGGYPFKDLQHKFLMAAASTTTDFSDTDFPQEIEIIPLPGHFFEMVGFRIPDGTVFLADCLSSTATLEKYQLTFIYDVAAYLQTLEMVAALPAKMFVPAHAEATSDIRPLVAANQQKIWEIAEHLKTICKEPLNFERILQRLFADYQLQMNYEQYVLVGSTVRSYLSWLKDTAQITASITDNQLLWQTIE
ncbi:MBL fold metallo-hydrolase [Candidatus Methanomassiliicoccus intestinalis]|uniref:MBL fold metallo-hydrolase n=1 Tax=Candidatus Methanomassiliicoccus intestinalis TaxID=1406512 RepID=UPI0037DDE07B